MLNINFKNMDILKNILTFLDGRKAKLIAIAGVVVGYLSVANIINDQLASAILAVLAILGGTAAFATDKVLGKRNELGTRRKY